MKVIRTLAMVMLAFLYLGGMYGHISGAAFPIIGTGHKAVDQFEGMAHDPIHPTIAECRHIPLVKPLVVAPVYAVELSAPQPAQVFEVVLPPDVGRPTLMAHPVSLCDRAPPLV